MKNIRVAIVDDIKLFSDALEVALNTKKGISVVLTAFNGIDFFNKLRTAAKLPDIVLLDYEMPKMDGLTVTKKLQKEYPSIKIIILTIHTEHSFIVSLIQNGVSGYIFKDIDSGEVVRAIESVHEGEEYYNPEVIRAISKKLISTKKVKSPNSIKGMPISSREAEILQLISEGYTSKEIGESLHIATRTVDTHRHKLLVKTNSKSIISLVVYAIGIGIVELKHTPRIRM